MIKASELGVYLVTAEPATEATIEIVLQAVRGGVRIVQLRDKFVDRDRLVVLLRRMHDQLRGTGTTLLVNDDVDAAAAVPGAGVHVGPDDLHPAEARLRLGPEVCIGWSIHHRDQLDDVVALRASDYLAASPVWPTPTKTDTTAPWGLDGLADLRAEIDPMIPLVGIGGIDIGNAAEVIGAGADGVAVVSAICSAADPGAAAAELCRVVEGARHARARAPEGVPDVD